MLTGALAYLDLNLAGTDSSESTETGEFNKHDTVNAGCR